MTVAMTVAITVRFIARTLGAAALACFAFAHAASAQAPVQAQPNAASIALAVQILEIKGGIGAFDPALDGVIIHHKGVLLQINPNASRALEEVERGVRADLAAKRVELRNEVARGYATQFSEQDLKDLIVFYKTPLGKKIIDREPLAAEEATKRVQVWVDKYAEDVSTKMRAELKKKGFSEF